MQLASEIFRSKHKVNTHSLQSSAVGLLESVYPNIASRSLSAIKYEPTHSALHSSRVVARPPNTPVQVCPGRYHEVIGFPVKGLIGRLLISKLYFPSDSSERSFEVP